MKPKIKTIGGDSNGAKSLVTEALGLIPDHWLDVLPKIEIKVVSKKAVPRKMGLIFGTKAGRNHNWSIAITGADRLFAEVTVTVFMANREGGEDDRDFQNELITMLLSRAVAYPYIRETVASAARKHFGCDCDVTLLTLEHFPDFLVKPDVFRKEQPRMAEFFGNGLKKAIASLD